LTVAIRAGVADVVLGLSVLLPVGIATGVYVKQLDNWLHAPSSGDPVAFRS
jgi:hypothetical protein